MHLHLLFNLTSRCFLIYCPDCLHKRLGFSISNQFNAEGDVERHDHISLCMTARCVACIQGSNGFFPGEDEPNAVMAAGDSSVLLYTLTAVNG